MLNNNDFPEITEVRQKHMINESALANYLQQQIDDDFTELTVQQFEGGQSNPTYLLSTQQKQYVLRKKPFGKLLKSAHQVDREYKVITALYNTDVPVPKTYLLCEDENIIGTMFYVMDYVKGRVFTNPYAQSLKSDERKTLYKDVLKILANLHAIDYQKVGLQDWYREGNYMQRQISIWTKQYHASETETIKEMNQLIDWLPKHIPQQSQTTIVHGDYRLGNCIVHPTEPKVVAVVDWELSTIGDPLADLSYLCVMYHTFLSSEQMITADQWENFYSEREFLALYQQYADGSNITAWDFYITYNLFRMAAIVQGVFKRGLDGNASSDHWKSMHGLCISLSEIAWNIINKGDK